VFTSGGTEAANLALLGLARGARGRYVLVGATEHSCVRECGAQLAREGFEVEAVPLASDGAIDEDALAKKLRPDTALVAQMLVNNEFGTIYPIARIASLVRARARGAKLVVDAVQALGKLDCALDELGADALVVSAHKIHGPKGAGAAIFASEPDLRPILHGGGQERGLRPGTENVAAIVGFGAAARIAESRRAAALEHLRGLRAKLVAELRELPGARVLEPGAAQLPSIVAVMLPGAPAEVLMHHLEVRGVYVSTGSACQALSKSLSPALAALGLSGDDVRRVLRFSMAATTTLDEVDRAARALREVSRELEQVST
jgi:cysteine desulfurase